MKRTSCSSGSPTSKSARMPMRRRSVTVAARAISPDDSRGGGLTPIFGRGSSHIGWFEEASGFIYDRYLQPQAFVIGEYVFAFPGKGFIAVKRGGLFYNRSMK